MILTLTPNCFRKIRRQFLKNKMPCAHCSFVLIVVVLSTVFIVWCFWIWILLIILFCPRNLNCLLENENKERLFWIENSSTSHNFKEEFLSLSNNSFDINGKCRIRKHQNIGQNGDIMDKQLLGFAACLVSAISFGTMFVPVRSFDPGDGIFAQVSFTYILVYYYLSWL